jgi:hypothetical protein
MSILHSSSIYIKNITSGLEQAAKVGNAIQYDLEVGILSFEGLDQCL